MIIPAEINIDELTIECTAHEERTPMTGGYSYKAGEAHIKEYRCPICHREIFFQYMVFLRTNEE